MSKVGYHTAASGVMAYQMALDVTANNMANVNTNGFKASRPSFADLLYTERNNDNVETQFGHGVRVQKTDMMFEQSTLRQTYRELDFAALEYLSSAGLRVLLAAQKVMNKQGEMIIKNVNDTINEIFEVTGFIDILTIE